MPDASYSLDVATAWTAPTNILKLVGELKAAWYAATRIWKTLRKEE